MVVYEHGKNLPHRQRMIGREPDRKDYTDHVRGESSSKKKTENRPSPKRLFLLNLSNTYIRFSRRREKHGVGKKPVNYPDTRYFARRILSRSARAHNINNGN